mmetsp:Transcript_36260/g.94307  ORF Transcript_36260/g.94307 Transcript_36260/m.94307 type:complete len:528 (-) Transcript_36260:389-1972(-)
MKGCAVVFLTLAVLFSSCNQADAAYNFFGHRLVQMELEEQVLGSKRANLYQEAVMYKRTTEKQDLARSVAVLKAEELDEDVVNHLLFERRLAGVLIVLPQSFNATSGMVPEEAIASKLSSLEELFYSRDSNAAVYFAVENEDMRGMLSDLDSSLRTDSIFVSVAAGDPKKIPTVPMHNIHMMLGGSAGEADAKSIAVVAYYDSFSAAPSLPGSIDSNGSGASAVLELARLFARLYSSTTTRGNANLLFVLTAGGHQNFAGARQFATQGDRRILDNIDYTLCLDTIGSGDELYLHYSKLAKDNYVQGFYDSIVKAGKREGVEVKMVHKKINLADPEESFEHEAFGRSRMLAATLSRFSESPTWTGRARLVDTHVEMDKLVRNVKVVANALIDLAYTNEAATEVDVFSGSMSVSKESLQSWLSTFGRIPRFAPIDAGVTGRTLVDDMKGYLTALSEDTTVQTFTLDKDVYAFYALPFGSMSAFVVKSALFEYALTLSVIAFLFSIHVYYKGFSSVLALLQPAKPKMKKM